MTENDDNGFDGPWWRYPPLRNALLAGVIAGAGFVLAHLGFVPEVAENVFYWVAIPLGGWHWAREGIEELIEEKEVGIEILMLAATAGSGLLGLWDEAAALVFLYGAAEGTEEYTCARASIRALLDLAPREARVLRDGGEITVPAETLKPGDVFVVRPGEAIPTDGTIKSGASSLDESPVTGESIPADKGPGMKVFAASINKQGALTVEATAVFADNTLSKIIHMVEEAQERKGKAQQWIERFGRRYSPAVLAASGLLLLVPWLLGLAWEEWSLRAVVLLVAAAPCALIMSTPVAMAAGIGAAGKRGILIKGGAHLEHLGMIQVVAFDKTGTLTHGEPVVTDVVTLDGAEQELLAIAAALEYYSEHPLARAIGRGRGLRGARRRRRQSPDRGSDLAHRQSRTLRATRHRPQDRRGAHRRAPGTGQDRGAGRKRGRRARSYRAVRPPAGRRKRGDRATARAWAAYGDAHRRQRAHGTRGGAATWYRRRARRSQAGG
jgi:Cd2+/Zn2+-exporting ATPase